MCCLLSTDLSISVVLRHSAYWMKGLYLIQTRYDYEPGKGRNKQHQVCLVWIFRVLSQIQNKHLIFIYQVEYFDLSSYHCTCFICLREWPYMNYSVFAQKLTCFRDLLRCWCNTIFLSRIRAQNRKYEYWLSRWKGTGAEIFKWNSTNDAPTMKRGDKDQKSLLPKPLVINIQESIIMITEFLLFLCLLFILYQNSYSTLFCKNFVLFVPLFLSPVITMIFSVLRTEKSSPEVSHTSGLPQNVLGKAQHSLLRL